MADDQDNVLTLTTEIVASYVGANSHVQASEIAEIIRSVRAALMEDSTPAAPAEAETPKATKGQITKSITPDALISFLDGKPYKTLKRHLGRHGHDMASYRAAYGLPSDYPSVAPNYSAQRSAMAKTIGLGAKGRGKAAADASKKAPSKKSKAAARLSDSGPDRS